jgi:hypothetical protein
MVDKCDICKNGIGKGKKHLVDLDTGKKMHIRCYKAEHGKLPAKIKHISYNPAAPDASLVPQLRRAGAKYIKKAKNPLTEQQKEKVREFAKYVAKGKSSNPAGEATTILNIDITKDAVEKALKLVGVPITDDNVTKLLSVLEGTADIDIEYNLDTPKDVIADMWGEENQPLTHPYSYDADKKDVYWLKIAIPEDTLVESLQKLEKDVNYNNKVYLLRLLQTSADMMIEGDLEDKGTLNDRWPHTVPIKANPSLKDITGKIKGVKKLTKDQLAKLMSMADKMPTPAGFDAYFESKIWPKVKKIGKGVIMGVSIGALISPVTTVPALVAIIGRNTKKIKKLEAKKFDQLHKALKYTMGRMLGVSALYVANGYDYRKTLADLQGARNPIPKVKINWEKLANGKVIAAAISLADGIAGLFYMGAAGTAAGGGVGAMGAGVGAAAGAPAGGTAGVTAGAIKGVGEVIVALGLFISSLKGAVVVGNPKGLGAKIQSVGAYLKTPEGQKTAERAIKLGKNVFEYASKALAKANPEDIMEQVKVFLKTPEGKEAVQRAVDAGKEVIPYAIEIMKGKHNPSRTDIEAGITDEAEGNEKYLQWADEFDAQGQKPQAKLMRQFAGDEARHGQALDIMLAHVNPAEHPQFFVKTGQDLASAFATKFGKDPGHIEVENYKFGARLITLEDGSKYIAWLENELKTFDPYHQYAKEHFKMNPRTKPEIVRAIINALKQALYAFEDRNINMARESRSYAYGLYKSALTEPEQREVLEQLGDAPAEALQSSVDQHWTEDLVYEASKEISRAKENPRKKPKKDLHLTPLKAEEYATWEWAIVFYLNEGQSDARAYKSAWNDTKLEHPRLSDYDDIDWKVTNKALGLEVKEPKRSNPLSTITYKVSMMKAEEMYKAIRTHFITNMIHGTVGTDAYYQDSNNFMTVVVECGSQHADAVHDIARQFGAELTEDTIENPSTFKSDMGLEAEAWARKQIRSGAARVKYGLETDRGSQYFALRERGMGDEDAQFEILGNKLIYEYTSKNPEENPAKRGAIEIRELSDKPGRYIVVEEIGGTIVQLLSGVAGQSKEEAEEIAQRIRKRNPAHWKKGGVIQSMRFKKSKWSPSQAQHWLRSHGFEAPEVDETKSELRYRQVSPSKIKAGHYGSKPFGKKALGIRALFGEPNPARTIKVELIDVVVEGVIGLPHGWDYEVYDDMAGSYGGPSKYEGQMTEDQIYELSTKDPPIHDKVMTIIFRDGIPEFFNVPKGYRVKYRDTGETQEYHGWSRGNPSGLTPKQIKNLQYLIRNIDNNVKDPESAKLAKKDYIKIVKAKAKPTNFDIRITREMAIDLLNNDLLPKGWEIMCKEYGQDNSDDNDWSAVYKEEIEGDPEDIPSDWKTFEIWAGSGNPTKSQAKKVADEHRATGKRARVFPIKGGYSAYVDGPRANPQSRANIESAIFSRMELARIHHSRRQFKAAQDIVSQALGLYHAFNAEEMEQFNEYWPAYKHLMSKPVSKWTPKEIENSLVTTRGRGQNNPGNPTNPTKPEAQASAEAARARGKRARVLKTADNYSPFISKDVVPKGKKAVVPKKKLVKRVKKPVVPKTGAIAPAPESVVPKLEAKVEKSVEKTEALIVKASEQAEKAVEKNEDLMLVVLPDPPPVPRFTPYDLDGEMTAVEYREQFKAPNKALSQWNAAYDKLYNKIEKQQKGLASGSEERKALEKSLSDMKEVRNNMIKSFNGSMDLLWAEEKAKVLSKARASGYVVPKDKEEDLAQVVRSDIYDDKKTKTGKISLVVEAHLKRILKGPAKEYTITLTAKTGFKDDLTTFNDYKIAEEYLYKKADELKDDSWVRAEIVEKSGTEQKVVLSADLDKIPAKIPTEGKLKISDIPKIVKEIMPKNQQKAIAGSEEFWGIIKNLEERAREIPPLYAQEKLGDDAIVYLHYFVGGSDWYITEWTDDDFFGFAVLNQDYQNAELGYVSKTELTSGSVELDFHWKKRTLKEAKQKFEEREVPKEKGVGQSKEGNTIMEDKDGGRFYIETSPSGLRVRQSAPRALAPGGKRAPYTPYELYKQGRTNYLTLEELTEFDEKYKEKEPEPAKQVPPPPPLETYTPSPAAPPPTAKPQPTTEELADIIAKKIKEQMGE